MTRLCSLVAFLAVAATPARAHFVWILPGDPADPKPTARAVFSDKLAPDGDFHTRIKQTEFFARNIDGKATAIKYAEGKDALELAAPEAGAQTIAGLCRYGVSTRTEPAALLYYYAKGYVGLDPKKGTAALAFPYPWDKLPLEVVPALEGKDGPTARVYWKGKPLADAEVSQVVPGADRPVEGKTDKDGFIQLEKAEKAGLFGIWARHTEEKEGELDGKKYKVVRHYATVTFPVVGKAKVETGAASAVEKAKEDPAASKLLADARAARATWRDFPGFTADVEVNFDGKVTRGTVTVDAAGKVAVKVDDAEAEKWAARMLGSIVGHRIGGGELNTACAFADAVTDHPLGRAIQVLDDEYHSSYRVRDRQVIVVNRQRSDARFTITVTENRVNAEKKFLPACYVVNTWDLKTDALTSSETHHQTWDRVGTFDLPGTALVVTAMKGKQQARGLTLSNHRLASGK